MENPTDFLERKLLVSVLLEISHNQGCIIGDIAPMNTPKWRTKYNRIYDLEALGVIHIDRSPRKFNTARLSLTERGEELARLLAPVLEAVEILPELPKNN